MMNFCVPKSVGNGENGGSIDLGIDGINPQNPRSNFGILAEEPVGLAGDEVGRRGGRWLSLNNKEKSRGEGRGSGCWFGWRVGRSLGFGFMGPGMEGGCWMGLGGEWLWDGFAGWSLKVVAMRERERKREGEFLFIF
ncbi:unnamed protein product [Prunus armeniaca]